MDDSEYRDYLRQASVQVKYGKWRTIGLVVSSLFLLTKAVMTGDTALYGLFTLTLIISWQSWQIYRSGVSAFKLVEYFGKKFGQGE